MGRVRAGPKLLAIFHDLLPARGGSMLGSV
jgi:hypothetical protein